MAERFSNYEKMKNDMAVDKNILDFMHYETMMFALSHVMGRLKEENKI